MEKGQDFKEALINNTTQGECSECHPSIDEFTEIRVGDNTFYYIFNYLSEGQFGVLYYRVGDKSVIQFGLNATTLESDWLEQALNKTYDVKKEPSHILFREILSTFKFIDENEISWESAVELIRNCQVRMVAQTHSRNVSLSLKDGTSRSTVEPAIDMVLQEAESASKKCGFNIGMVTE